MLNDVTAEIEALIQDAYIGGVHGEQSASRAARGFHPDFVMFVRTPSGLETVGMHLWLSRVRESRVTHPELWNLPTRCEFLPTEVAGNAASVRLRVYKGDTVFSDDFMLLYRMNGGWRVVSKVFSLPAR